jgi:hypothetical protein
MPGTNPAGYCVTNLELRVHWGCNLRLPPSAWWSLPISRASRDRGGAAVQSIRGIPDEHHAQDADKQHAYARLPPGRRHLLGQQGRLAGAPGYAESAESGRVAHLIGDRRLQADGARRIGPVGGAPPRFSDGDLLTLLLVHQGAFADWHERRWLRSWPGCAQSAPVRVPPTMHRAPSGGIGAACSGPPEAGAAPRAAGGAARVGSIPQTLIDCSPFPPQCAPRGLGSGPFLTLQWGKVQAPQPGRARSGGTR